MAWTSSTAVGLEAKLLLRRLRVYYCAVQVYLRIKVTQFRGRRLRVDAAGDGPDAARSAALWSATHTANARRMLSLALSLEALWIKVRPGRGSGCGGAMGVVGAVETRGSGCRHPVPP